jgi:tetratricopeptide (TPR) repeat protein
MCRRLDGLPLAIELVAPRLKFLSPQEVLAGLERSMDSMGEGPRDLPARQRTIRDTIEWSYNLLSEDEKILFRRLSVFVGGFTLEAAEAVCAHVKGGADDGGGAGAGRTATLVRIAPVRELLLALVGKNIVFRDQNPKLPHQIRFGLLETTREFAQQLLSQSEEMDEIYRGHAEFFCKLGEDTEPKLISAEVVEAANLLESEIGNIRVALGFAKARPQTETGLRILCALRKFWTTRGFVGEGTQWTMEFIGAAGHSDTVQKARVLATGGVLAGHRGPYDEAVRLLDESLDVYSRLGNEAGMADALTFGGRYRMRQGRFQEAEEFFDKALVLAKDLGDRCLSAHLMTSMATLAHCLEDDERSFALNSEAVQLLPPSTRELGYALNNLGLLNAHRGDVDLGVQRLKKSLLIGFEVRADVLTMSALESLAEVACRQERYQRGITLLSAADAGRRLTGAALQGYGKAEIAGMLRLPAISALP